MQLLLFLRLWAVAELGSAIPEAGGGYLWVREGLGRPNTFISEWMDGMACSYYCRKNFSSSHLSLISNLLLRDPFFNIYI